MKDSKHEELSKKNFPAECRFLFCTLQLNVKLIFKFYCEMRKKIVNNYESKKIRIVLLLKRPNTMKILIITIHIPQGTSKLWLVEMKTFYFCKYTLRVLLVPMNDLTLRVVIKMQ